MVSAIRGAAYHTDWTTNRAWKRCWIKWKERLPDPSPLTWITKNLSSWLTILTLTGKYFDYTFVCERISWFLYPFFFLYICFRPRPGDPPRIERDDFPAPPYPYTDPERRRRWSESSKKISVSDSNDFDDRSYEPRDVVDGETDEGTPDDPKVKVILFNFNGF